MTTAYFVGLPTVFSATALSTDAKTGAKTLEVSLSYSANFHPAGPRVRPGGLAAGTSARLDWRWMRQRERAECVIIEQA